VSTTSPCAVHVESSAQNDASSAAGGAGERSGPSNYPGRTEQIECPRQWRWPGVYAQGATKKQPKTRSGLDRW
jgi:hypothetical protein